MGRTILVSGGGRSGKSSYALRLAESFPGPRLFVATCPVLDGDGEMLARIARHKVERQKGGWETLEETVRLPEIFRERRDRGVILVDCLTLWINNLMYEAERAGREVTESDMADRCRELLDAITGCSGTTVLVTNEVGLGIIPANAAARRFRDLAGRCNQIVAAAADCVIFMICGIPLFVKGSLPSGRDDAAAAAGV
ncbi:MAG: bifunctional adenosylcobinamide kinase/adenosylcobinamide-phosphate guanylyltransferase [Planctomycetota bacterium]|nr:bifunctional adenosylcobinamide kinase/adenosylcobinamide-phosphate guanylyltransferase [Planctomycetota bacterium]